VNSPFPPLFESYAEAVGGLLERYRLLKTDLLVKRFQIFGGENLEVYYAPFDSVNVRAKVIIIGITPGWTQMEIAFRRAKAVLRNGGTMAEAVQTAKAEASFAGAMRSNLVRMLDEIGLQKALRLESCCDLFGSSNHLVHTTSAVRHPVFVHGRNYTGHSPDLLSHPVLARYVTAALAPELTALSKALVVPLGECVNQVLRHLIQAGVVTAERCLLGFPHPSAANGHRRIQFEQRRDSFVRVCMEWSDA
jgi:hypothetical protein